MWPLIQPRLKKTYLEPFENPLEPYLNNLSNYLPRLNISPNPPVGKK